MYTTGFEAPRQCQYVIETYTHFIHMLCAHNWILLQLYVCIAMLILLRKYFQQHAELDSEYVHTCSPLSANLQLVLAYTGQYICYWALDSYIVSCLLFYHIDVTIDVTGAIAALLMSGLVLLLLLLLLVVVNAALLLRKCSRSCQCQVPGNV